MLSMHPNLWAISPFCHSCTLNPDSPASQGILWVFHASLYICNILCLAGLSIHQDVGHRDSAFHGRASFGLSPLSGFPMQELAWAWQCPFLSLSSLPETTPCRRNWKSGSGSQTSSKTTHQYPAMTRSRSKKGAASPFIPGEEPRGVPVPSHPLLGVHACTLLIGLAKEILSCVCLS